MSFLGNTPTTARRLPVIFTATLLAAALGFSGCSSGVAPSRTATGAATGAGVGALGGAVVGSSSSMGTTTGVLGGAAAGALVGAVVGMTQDMKERKEQDRLSQERAYQQELARTREAEARFKAAMEEELAAAQGFRISDAELNEAQGLVEDATQRLTRLREERAAAIAKKKALDEAQERLLMTEAEIARLEEELARLKGEPASGGSGSSGTVTPFSQPPSFAPSQSSNP